MKLVDFIISSGYDIIDDEAFFKTIPEYKLFSLNLLMSKEEGEEEYMNLDKNMSEKVPVSSINVIKNSTSFEM